MSQEQRFNSRERQRENNFNSAKLFNQQDVSRMLMFTKTKYMKVTLKLSWLPVRCIDFL